MFLAKRGKDEHKSLYRIDVEGGEARRVLTFGSDIAGYAMKPDGVRVTFLATDPEPKAKADLKKKGFSQILYEEELKPVRIWIAGLGSTAPAKAIKLPGSASELRGSPVGESIAVEMAPTPGVDDSFMSKKVYATLAGPAGMLRVDNRGQARQGRLEPGRQAPGDDRRPRTSTTRRAAGWSWRMSRRGRSKDVLPGYMGHVADIAWVNSGCRVAFVGDEGTGTVLGMVAPDGSGLVVRAHRRRDRDIPLDLAGRQERPPSSASRRSIPGEVFFVERGAIGPVDSLDR